MSKLKEYVDGSWLFKVCASGGVLANRMEYKNQPVTFDFTRLDMILLDHAAANTPECTELGERYLCMSVFTLPLDFNTWPMQFSDVSHEDVFQTRNAVSARNHFIKSAKDAGYSDEWVLRPSIEKWFLDILTGKSGKYQEKCADTSIVFMLGQSLVLSPDDIHRVVTGDNDVLPPVALDDTKQIRNLFLTTTHLRETRVEHRQSSLRLNNFPFRIPPVYLQDNLLEIVKGRYVYECSQCQLVCSRDDSPPRHLPCCHACYRAKGLTRYPNVARCV